MRGKPTWSVTDHGEIMKLIHAMNQRMHCYENLTVKNYSFDKINWYLEARPETLDNRFKLNTLDVYMYVHIYR